MKGDTDHRPQTVIQARSGWMILDLSELWEYREVLYRLAARDLTLRYRQTAAGVLWVIAQPLLGAVIFTIVFGVVAHLDSGGVPYIVFTFAGLTAWTTFASILTRTSSSLVANPSLITRVFFPRLLLPLSTLLSTAVDFGASLLLMAGLLFAFRVAPGPALLTLPFWVAILAAGGAGAGLLLAPLIVRYRDVQHVLPVLIQLLLFASPVAYSVAAVPPRVVPFFALNPLSGLLDGFRWSLLGVAGPTPAAALYSTLWALAMLALGTVVFSRMEREFADVI